ncbi:MAG TPA: molecular chaperone HtpG [Oscillospiraceae bacterium]|nr:molecular chaperone HtpG [Oscillospiraceae bacterium]HXK77829.1 molecular chaperone HtpG [Oscillospiraceae bacterium]
MAKKQFKAESKRLLELMIHSIYTHKEIFLREIISNASDAIDKLAYLALTDDKVGMSRSDFQIVVTADEGNRLLTVSDNGIGMTQEDLEQNLGIIARSGSFQFKKEAASDGKEGADLDVIGQFGVGFYSAFMVSDRITVISKAYGSDTAYRWESTGSDGYTIAECERDGVGTDVIMHIKPDTEEDDYGQYLNQYNLQSLIKRYSDYIRYPIRMEVEQTRPKPKAPDAPDDQKTEYETIREWKTLNSMVPVWQRKKNEVTEQDYNDFYKQKFGEYEDPLDTILIDAEGVVSYKALIFIPSEAPYDYYSRDFQKGLQLYSSGVLIMEKCADLTPEPFRFIQGVVDTPDVSLNISREMLQHDRQLKLIEGNIEKKVKAKLLKLLEEDREKYEKFWKAFGLQIKYSAASDYGSKKELLRDLILFPCSNGKLSSLEEYRKRMPEDQQYIYYATGESEDRLSRSPQAERILDKGYEVLWLTQDVDEFVVQVFGDYDGKKLKSVADEDALPETEEEKKAAEEKAESGKAVLDFLKETLGDKIKEARISRILKSHAVCLTADGPISIEMEKYLRKQGGEMTGFKTERVLEINADSPAFEALKNAVAADPELAKKYAELLYDQALIIADLPLDDPAAYSDLVCGLMK